MQKDTTERILDYVIRINTELLKTNTRMGDIESDVKDLRQEMRDGFGELRQEMKEGFEKADKRLNTLETDVKEINTKLDWMGEVVFVNHENRIKKLESAFA